MKSLGAIAALEDIVAFNKEVANELRAVFDDFRSTNDGRKFVVGSSENFRTDELGESTFALHSGPGEPEYSLQVEIHSSGVAEIYTKSADCILPLNFRMGSQPDLSHESGGATSGEIAAAHIIGSILELDRSSRFGMGFHRYVRDRLTGRDPHANLNMDFPDREI